MKYIPILQAKKGELTAIEKLSHVNNFHPLFSVTEETSHILINNISKAWPYSKYIFVDGHKLKKSGYTDLYSNLIRNEQILFCPVLYGLGKSEYQDFLISCAYQASNGLCLRMDGNFFKDEKNYVEISTFLENIKSKIKNIDILLDFGFLGTDQEFIAPFVSKTLAAIVSLYKWRDIILSSTSFPSQLDAKPSTLYSISRQDWLLWKKITNEQRFNNIAYSDYTCLGIPKEANAPISVPKVRYTIEENWLYARGKAKQNTDYYGLAKQIVNSGKFQDKNFSWGDAVLAEKAESKGGPGSGMTWISTDVNHHISYVLHN